MSQPEHFEERELTVVDSPPGVGVLFWIKRSSELQISLTRKNKIINLPQFFKTLLVLL